VYATTDDYSGEYMTNPTVPSEYTNVIDQPVVIKKHSIIGTGSTILPGVTIEEGCALCAMTLITKDTKPWGIYMGYQGVRIKERSQELLKMDISKLEE
jgi:galactoside O-acetyltransferase